MRLVDDLKDKLRVLEESTLKHRSGSMTMFTEERVQAVEEAACMEELRKSEKRKVEANIRLVNEQIINANHSNLALKGQLRGSSLSNGHISADLQMLKRANQ